MPTNRVRRRRNRQPEVHPAVIAYLRDETPPDDPDSRRAILVARFFQHDGFYRAWEVCREHILTGWIVESPGTRPSIWWDVDAPRDIRPDGPYFYHGEMPLLRERLGGIGTPWSDLGHVPTHTYGIPARWIRQCDIEEWRDRLAGKRGPLVTRRDMETLQELTAVKALDPSNPPKYESQAAYLKRHGLFLPGEEKRLKPADFEPDWIEVRDED